MRAVIQTVKSAMSRFRTLVAGRHVEAMLCRSGDHSFLVPAGDFTIGRKLAYEGRYNQSELDTLRTLLRRHGIDEVLVVGTHVGYFVVKLAAEVRHVTGIEANPDTFRLLEANLWMNRVPNVTLHAMAATSAPTELQFVRMAENTGGSHVLRPQVDSRAQAITVRGDTVDSLGLRPGLVLIDTEGHEIEVLRGMQDTLRHAHAVSCELIPRLLDDAGQTPAAQIDLLAAHFDVFHVDALDAPAMDAAGIAAWFDALRGDARAVSRNVIALRGTGAVAA